MVDKQKIVYLGVAVAVAVLLVIVISAATNKGNKCVPSKDVPDLKKLNSNNVASEDSSILAHLNGYIQLLNGEGYLPLEITQVSHEKPTDKMAGSVTLKGECATLKISYSEEATKGTYKYGGLEMFVVEGQKSDLAPHKICDFSNKFDFNKQPLDQYYSCNQKQVHECPASKPSPASVLGLKDDTTTTSTTTPAPTNKHAELVLNAFEFQIGGIVEDVKKGKFSKMPFAESCELWQ